MKLRIQDNSIRFRITLKELEALEGSAGIEKQCAIPGGGVFRYAARADATLAESRVRLEPHAIVIELCAADHAHLADPANEGVHLRREWNDAEGNNHRFMAMIEKDRPASTCKKVEAWIYEGHHGSEPQLTPIPGRTNAK